MRENVLPCAANTSLAYLKTEKKSLACRAEHASFSQKDYFPNEQRKEYSA